MQEIVGEKISLRPITNEDTDLIVKWRNNNRVRGNFIYRGEFTRQVHEKWLRERVETGKVVQFIILENETKRPIGSVYFRDVDTTVGKAEYGIFIGEDDAVGFGYGTKAAELALSYAFGTMKLHKVFLRVLADNSVARKSYEKVGFVQEGYFKDEVFLDGEYKDLIFMAIFSNKEME